MKVAMWYNNRDIRIEEMPTPLPGPREMLVKVHSCGICGSDIVEWYRLPRAPLVQGHEVGAEVVEIGREVSNYEPGDRIFIAPKVPCFHCRYCRDEHFPQCTEVKDRLPGGYAEYILAPENLVQSGTYKLPDSISYDQSTFIEPLACALRAQRIAGLREGQTALILGCGMSGLLHVKLAKARGCRVAATDVNPRRRDWARQFGADPVLDATGDVLNELLDGFGRKAEVVILSTSALPAIEQAWSCVDKGGALVFFAVPDPEKDVSIPINDLWMKEVRILTSYYCGPPDIREAMDLLAEGRIEVEDMVTHRLPLADIVRGFELVLDGQDALKVIIRPQDGV